MIFDSLKVRVERDFRNELVQKNKTVLDLD